MLPQFVLSAVRHINKQIIKYGEWLEGMRKHSNAYCIQIQLSFIQCTPLMAFSSHFSLLTFTLKGAVSFNCRSEQVFLVMSNLGLKACFLKCSEKIVLMKRNEKTGEQWIVWQSELMPIWKKLNWGRRCKTFGNVNSNYSKSWQ